MSVESMIAIAPAVPADIPAISQTLAGAFHADPVFEWLSPDPASRRARLPAVFAAFAEVYLTHGETYVAGQDAGAALWAPAGREPVPADQAERLGARMSTALQDDVDRGLQLQELVDEHHPEQPCFYLQFVGVAPEQQGCGIGSRLLTTVLQRCDATGTPAYLEATSVGNRRLYERHGFDTVDELTLPHGPALWPMWREPMTAPGHEHP